MVKEYMLPYQQRKEVLGEWLGKHSLTEVHKAERVEFGNWLLSKPQKFANNVIWSNEKWFVIRQHPNKQTERDWAPFDAEI